VGETGQAPSLRAVSLWRCRLRIAERLIHQIRIEHRTFDILHVGQEVSRRKKIENPHLSMAGDKRRYQVLSDKAAAASDKYPGHERGSGST